MLGSLLPTSKRSEGWGLLGSACSSPANSDDGDSAKTVTLAMLRSELELFVNGRLQQELAHLKRSILDELGKGPTLRTSTSSLDVDTFAEALELAEEPPLHTDNVRSNVRTFVSTPTDTEQVQMIGSPPTVLRDDLDELSAALHLTHQLSDERFHWHMAVATLEITLKDELRFGFELDKGSVYGTVVALPQIARSAKWPRTLLGLCVRTWGFLFINYVIELKLLYLIWEEENVMDRFAGEMNLCDFGSHMSQWPGAQLEGPLGSTYSPARLYGWAAWSARTFVKDSLAALFPDKLHEILEKVDPGEYGMESSECRLLCCFVFVLAIMEDIFAIVRLTRLLYTLPSRADSWIEYKALASHERDDHEAGFEHTTLRICGMPAKWKLINVVLVLIPRTMICVLTLKTGIHFLMESAGIADGIVNALALSFIVSMPGLVQSVMASRASRNIMKKLEAYRADKLPQSCIEILTKHLDYQRLGDWKTVLNLLPVRLTFTIFVTVIFVLYYYASYCTLDGNNRWVSKPMHLPVKVKYNFYEFLTNAFLPLLFPLESEKEPYWQCPDELGCK